MSGESNQVTLKPIEIARLRVEDGLGTEDDLQLLANAGVDVEADSGLRAALQVALGSSETPPIADAVMLRLGTATVPVGVAMAQELDEAPEVSSHVMAMLGSNETSTLDVAKAIYEEGGEPGSLWNGVATAIDVDPGVDLGELLRAAVEHEAGPSNIEWMPKARPYWKVGAATGVIFAMAAAVLLWVQASVPNADVVAQQALDELPFFEGPVEIESLDVGTANIAQVLQFDEDSPTIIFVGELEE